MRLLILLLVLFVSNVGFAQTPFQSLNYLYSIKGSKAIGGMHNRQPNSNPNTYSQQLNNITGVWPGLYSADFQFEPNEIANRQTMIDQAITEWNNGAMINIMWHACNPAKQEPCYWDSNGVLSQMSNYEWDQLITDGTAINASWKSMMDDVAFYLQQLEDEGVEVFFRPLHEMNQGMFWWGGRPGPNGTARLYQITHDYLTYQKGLTNLIWVWNLQDYSSLSSDLNSYDPGGQYWDVLTMDMYWSDGQGYTGEKYSALLSKAGTKPIGIGECEDLPAVNLLNSQPEWSFFMGWSELTFQTNSNQKIQEIYWSDRVITLNEMPGWSNNPNPGDENIAYQKPVTASSTESAEYAAGNAVDANGNTRWASTYADNQNYIIDLQGTYNINRIVLSWEAAYASSYQIQVSDDNVNWTTIYENYNGDGGSDDITLSGTGCYIKLYAITRATSYGFSLWEFEVYGSSAGARIAASDEDQRSVLTRELVSQPYPNPFTGEVYFPLNGKTDQNFHLSIYNLNGELVRTYSNMEKAIQSGYAVWDGKNKDGDTMANGIYFYRLGNENQSFDGKIIKE